MPTDFLAGVIEGFYGPPWSQAERFELFDLMEASGLNTYLYAPKDDLKHRAIWREPYILNETAELKALLSACRKRNLRFIYALAPGLDIRYGASADRDQLRRRCGQMVELGCQDFALLFDDIPDRIDPSDLSRWGSLAAAQADVANELSQSLRRSSAESRFLFCPTPYCGRMAERRLGGDGYLATIGRDLTPEIDVFWTGPEIISREISVGHIEDLRAVLGRKPVLWDNLFANDYDGRRFFDGPYEGRSPELRREVGGILVNPNTEFPLNFVPLRTLAEYVRGEREWNPRSAYRDAVEEWLKRFETVGAPLKLEDLVLLTDCYYLPHEHGTEAKALLKDAALLLATPPANWGEELIRFRQRATRLRDLCARLPELRDRPLFHALSRRIWDLREELDLLLGWVRIQSERPEVDRPWRSDFHLPGTFRGGMIAELQALLVQRPDGTFVPQSKEGVVQSALK